MTRRDTLLATLERALERTPPALEEEGSLRLQTLFSVPRRINSIYPWAHVGAGEPVATWQEHVVITAGWEPHGGSVRLFYALELYVYTIPAQSAALVYVSKLDSTGFGPSAVPSNIRRHLDGKERDSPSLTTILTAAAIEHFVSRKHWGTSVTTSRSTFLHAHRLRTYSPHHPKTRISVSCQTLVLFGGGARV